MPPSPVDTFLVLAIYDMRNVFALRFIAWGRTCYAGTGAPINVGWMVFDFWITKVSCSFAWGRM